MIKVGDVVSAGGADVYTVEAINDKGMAQCYWERGQSEIYPVSRLKKLDHIYVGSEKIMVNQDEY